MIAGNYLYSSPETIYGQSPNFMIDWWALGVLFFHFLAGTTPFYDPSRERAMNNILDQKVNWEVLNGEISNACRQFISDILVKPLAERLGYKSEEDILRHEYFVGDLDFYEDSFNDAGPISLVLKGPGDPRYFNYTSVPVDNDMQQIISDSLKSTIDDGFSLFTSNNY